MRGVPLSLNGTAYTLRLDMNALAELEERGYDLDKLDELFGGGKLVQRVQVFVFACLRSEDDPPTLKDIGRWITPGNITDVVGKVREVFASAFPKPDKESPPNRPGAGIGRKSSALRTAPSP